MIARLTFYVSCKLVLFGMIRNQCIYSDKQEVNREHKFSIARLRFNNITEDITCPEHGM